MVIFINPFCFSDCFFFSRLNLDRGGSQMSSGSHGINYSSSRDYPLYSGRPSGGRMGHMSSFNSDVKNSSRSSSMERKPVQTTTTAHTAALAASGSMQGRKSPVVRPEKKGMLLPKSVGIIAFRCRQNDDDFTFMLFILI